MCYTDGENRGKTTRITIMGRGGSALLDATGTAAGDKVAKATGPDQGRPCTLLC